jgi:hypothetical protein
MADNLNPACIIPIHTFHPEQYGIFGKKVLIAEDGKQLRI